jgi:hypothetical protein
MKRWTVLAGDTVTRGISQTAGPYASTFTSHHAEDPTLNSSVRPDIPYLSQQLLAVKRALQFNSSSADAVPTYTVTTVLTWCHRYADGL